MIARRRAAHRRQAALELRIQSVGGGPDPLEALFSRLATFRFRSGGSRRGSRALARRKKTEQEQAA
ncbi:MAG: hypothetical protein ACODAA_03500, partial [Gemmatimonadota bacterium]